MNSVLEQTDLQTTDNDEGKYAHYGESVSVTEGYITGKPVVAVCGQVFVPSRDPKKFPICPICKEIVDALLLDEN